MNKIKEFTKEEKLQCIDDMVDILKNVDINKKDDSDHSIYLCIIWNNLNNSIHSDYMNVQFPELCSEITKTGRRNHKNHISNYRAWKTIGERGRKIRLRALERVRKEIK